MTAVPVKQIPVHKAVALVKAAQAHKDFEMPFTTGFPSDSDEAKESGYKEGFRVGQRLLRAEILRLLEGRAKPKALRASQERLLAVEAERESVRLARSASQRYREAEPYFFDFPL